MAAESPYGAGLTGGTSNSATGARDTVLGGDRIACNHSDNAGVCSEGAVVPIDLDRRMPGWAYGREAMIVVDPTPLGPLTAPGISNPNRRTRVPRWRHRPTKGRSHDGEASR
jgi:hypothetical protein